jgi:hypothetical protein
MDPYEDIEDPQSNERRLARISESINRALLYDTTGVQPSCNNNNNNNNCIIYIIGCALIVTLTILIIILVKNIN